MRKLLFYLFLSCVSLQLSAQTAEEDSVAAIAHEQDSIIQSLRNKVEEMTMQQVMLLAELERTGRIARLDSMAQAERQHHIDSLRQITKGAPVVVDGDTLLVLYAQKGGMTSEARAALVVENVEDVGQKLTFNPDSLYIVDGEIVTDIMAGEKVIMSITDIDGLWQNTTRQKLAESYIVVIQEKVNELHEDYGLKTLLTRIFWAVLLIILQLLLIRLTRWLFRRYKFRFTRNVIQWLKPLLFKDYEVLNTHRQGVIVITVYDSLRILLVLLQLMISIPLLFIIFPETKTFTLKIIGYILDPIRDILNIVGSQLECLFMPPQFTLISFQPHNAALDAVVPALHGQKAVSATMIGRRVIFQGSSQDDHMDAVRSTASMNAVIGLEHTYPQERGRHHSELQPHGLPNLQLHGSRRDLRAHCSHQSHHRLRCALAAHTEYHGKSSGRHARYQETSEAFYDDDIA